MTKNIDLRHQYGISVAEAQIFLLVNTKIALTLIVLNHTIRQIPDSFYRLNRDLVKFL